MSELPKLFIGPWVGEFGIEILQWQGLARTIAQSRDWQKIVASSSMDRAFLYEDFADEFIPFSNPTEHTVGPHCKGFRKKDAPWHGECRTKRGDVWLSPHVSGIQYRTIAALAASKSTFRNFAKGANAPRESFDILIHARATRKSGQDYKNWPVATWEGFVEMLPHSLKVASVGSKTGAHKIRGTADLRGISLAQLAGHCGAARMMVGPSSGTIHFALHCGLSVLTWMGEHRHHYFPQWNPLGAPLVCLNGWQPTIDLVRTRFRDLWWILETQKDPIKYLVVATKRSGHHALIEWLMQLHSDDRLTHLNDCMSTHITTPPHFASFIPSESLLPKQLHQGGPTDLVVTSGKSLKRGKRIFSIEGPNLRDLPYLPEAQVAERLVFVLRDSMNLAASYYHTFRKEVRKRAYLSPALTEMIKRYRDYLMEATGRTQILNDKLRAKTLFISYNRWHADPAYRQTLVESLAQGSVDPPRGAVAKYGPRSGFQASTTPADVLDTLQRWKHGVEHPSFVTATCDPELHEAEVEFHGCTLPLFEPSIAWRNEADAQA